MRLLVGGDSEIAEATRRTLVAAGQPVAATTRRPGQVCAERPLLDLAQPLDGWEPPAGTQAACIFAAVARLAACADDPVGSARINVTQTLALTERLVARGIYVLLLSTNQVFDGREPHTAPDAPTCPVSEYGRQKAVAEAGVRTLMDKGAPVAILRLAKVVSPGMPLLRTWAETLAKGEPIRAFSDMTMAPTPTAMVATAVARLMADKVPGIFQFTGPCDVTYAEVGAYIAERLGARASLVGRVSAASAGMPTGSTPANTTLDSSAVKERYGLSAPEPWDVIDVVVGGATSQSGA